jgi:hypothetical protein
MTDKRLKLTDLVVDRYVNLELFYSKLERQDNGCLLWTSSVKNNAGYGFIGFREVDPATGAPLKTPGKAAGGMMTVHRLAFMVANGRLPNQRNVNHTCHNKLCCEPTHLVEGTQREKLDAMRKAGIKGGREAGSRGWSYNHKQVNRSYKYTEAEIQWIRTASSHAIAERYGLDRHRASTKRNAFRNSYTWLPVPDNKEIK